MLDNENNNLYEDKQNASAESNSNPKASLKESFSVVASSESSKRAIVLAILGIMIWVMYWLFFKNKEDSKNNIDKQPSSNRVQEVKQQSTLVTQAQDQIQAIQPSTKLPAPLPLQQPTPPPPPPPPPPPVAPNIAITPPTTGNNIFSTPQQDKAPNEQEAEAKMKTNIMVFGGGGGGENSNSKTSTTSSIKANSSQFLGFDGGTIDSSKLEPTSSPRNIATKVTSLERTILQGKVIDAVLETAINTNLSGTVRGIVTRDVYAEHGKNVLIPKGSRLIGAYDTSVAPGQTRVNVSWSRLITPYGIDIKIDSVATDPLGRAGVIGVVNDNFTNQLANAFLVSYLIPYLTTRLSGTGNDQIVTTTNVGGTNTTPGNNTTPSNNTVPASNTAPGTVTTQGSAAALAMQSASQQFSQIATQAINNEFFTAPTITVDQGTRVNILVQKDLEFPEEAINIMRQAQNENMLQ